MSLRWPMGGTRLLGRAGVLTFLVGALGLASAGCSGTAAPSKPPGTNSPAASSAAGTRDSLRLAQCMRSNGVPNFPDPVANGSIAVDPKKGLDPKATAFKAAEEKCKQYMPKSGTCPRGCRSGGAGYGNGADSWSAADKLSYAKCMRQHGVPRFPDPASDGQLPAFDSRSGIDPLSPQFEQADKVCAKYQPRNMPKRNAAPAGGS
jgi:hypothetical protein